MPSMTFAERVEEQHFIKPTNTSLLERNGKNVEERINAVHDSECRAALNSTWSAVKLVFEIENDNARTVTNFMETMHYFFEQSHFVNTVGSMFTDIALAPGVLAGQFDMVLAEVESLESPEASEGEEEEDKSFKAKLRSRQLSNLERIDRDCDKWLTRDDEGMHEIIRYWRGRSQWYRQASQSWCIIQ